MMHSVFWLSLLLGCGGAEAPSDPVPDNHDEYAHRDHVGDAPEQDEDHAHGLGTGEPAPNDPLEVALGDAMGTLTPGEQTLTLSLVDSTGAAVKPAGEVRVLLQPTGGLEQRVVLLPKDDAWEGSASASGAVGYTATLSVPTKDGTVGGKVAWGTVPLVRPAPKTGG